MKKGRGIGPIQELIVDFLLEREKVAATTDILGDVKEVAPSVSERAVYNSISALERRGFVHRVKGTRLKKGIVRLIKAPMGEILSEDPESLFNENYRLDNEHEHEHENEDENENE